MRTAGTVGLIAAAAATCALGAPVALASSASRPTLPAYSGPYSKHLLKVRPGVIIYTGDGSGYLAGRKAKGKLRWSSWTSRSADATGANWVNDCTPDCARGKFHSYALALHAYRPKRLDGHLVFTRMTVTYEHKKPAYIRADVQTWKVVYEQHIFDWVFPA